MEETNSASAGFHVGSLSWLNWKSLVLIKSFIVGCHCLTCTCMSVGHIHDCMSIIV